MLGRQKRKCKIFGSFLDKEVGNLDDHGCPEIRDLVYPKAVEETWICSGYPFRHKTTLHFAEREAKLLDNWAMRCIEL